MKLYKQAILLLFIAARVNGQHVLLVSIDGLRPAHYRDTSWHTPNLRRLMHEGVYADHMLSVFPAYTYPSHAAMVTGALPARSGVEHNVRDSSGNWNWFLDGIKAPTIWQVLRGRGLTTAAVQWPVSVGSDITYNIPEIWDPKHPSDRIGVTRQYATPGLVEEIEQHVTGKLDSVSMNEENFSLDRNSAAMAGYIFRKYRPSLLAVHFALLDGMQHRYGTSHDSVRLAMEMIDSCVGRLMEIVAASGLKDSTTIVVVGDHGFADVGQAMRPNLLVKGLGVRFRASGGTSLLYGDKRGVDALRSRLDGLPDSVRQKFRIIERGELDMVGADSAALLALSAVPGMVFSDRDNGPLVVGTRGGHHGYDPRVAEMYTGFIASGVGVKKGRRIQELSVVDVAPLVAKLLGVEFAVPDGKVVEGLLVANDD